MNRLSSDYMWNSSEKEHFLSRLRQQPEKTSGPFAWWYRLTTPPQPPLTASFSLQERARRARFTSNILLLSLIVLLATLLGGVLEHNLLLISIIAIALLIQGIAALLNRLGLVLWAGLVIVAWFSCGLVFYFFASPQPLDVITLPSFALFIETDLLAVSLLPAWSVFVMALLNSILIWLALTVQSRTPALNHLLHTSWYQILFQPILVQLVVAVVAYLWARNAQQALTRAYRAEEVAALQHELAEQKHELEEGIDQIMQTHIQVANGNFAARAPVSEHHQLWKVASALNNLLARFQRMSQAEVELHRVKQENLLLHRALQQAKDTMKQQDFHSGT